MHRYELSIVKVHTDPEVSEQLWIRSLDGRMSFSKVIVAITNKHALEIRAVLERDVDYDPHACLNHPMHQQSHTGHAAWNETSGSERTF
ncbi:MAG: hypothetical protein ABIQ36_05585 [Rhodanobacter sp.]